MVAANVAKAEKANVSHALTPEANGSTNHHSINPAQPDAYGRGAGVGRALTPGLGLGVGLGRGVDVGVGVAVAVAVAVGVGVGVGVPAPAGAWMPTAMGEPVLKKPTVALAFCGG